MEITPFRVLCECNIKVEADDRGYAPHGIFAIAYHGTVHAPAVTTHVFRAEPAKSERNFPITSDAMFSTSRVIAEGFVDFHSDCSGEQSRGFARQPFWTTIISLDPFMCFDLSTLLEVSPRCDIVEAGLRSEAGGE